MKQTSWIVFSAVKNLKGFIVNPADSDNNHMKTMRWCTRIFLTPTPDLNPYHKKNDVLIYWNSFEKNERGSFILIQYMKYRGRRDFNWVWETWMNKKLKRNRVNQKQIIYLMIFSFLTYRFMHLYRGVIIFVYPFLFSTCHLALLSLINTYKSSTSRSTSLWISIDIKSHHLVPPIQQAHQI